MFRVLIFYIWKMGFELLIDFCFIVTKVASWVWIWNWNSSYQVTYYYYFEIMDILTSWLGFQIEILISYLPLATEPKPTTTNLTWNRSIFFYVGFVSVRDIKKPRWSVRLPVKSLDSVNRTVHTSSSCSTLITTKV